MRTVGLALWPESTLQQILKSASISSYLETPICPWMKTRRTKTFEILSSHNPYFRSPKIRKVHILRTGQGELRRAASRQEQITPQHLLNLIYNVTDDLMNQRNSPKTLLGNTTRSPTISSKWHLLRPRVVQWRK